MSDTDSTGTAIPPPLSSPLPTGVAVHELTISNILIAHRDDGKIVLQIVDGAGNERFRTTMTRAAAGHLACLRDARAVTTHRLRWRTPTAPSTSTPRRWPRPPPAPAPRPQPRLPRNHPLDRAGPHPGVRRMTPHKQLILHDTSNGQFGDCDRTAIACLLDMAPDDVPHWYDGFNGFGQANATALEIRRNWLADRGLFLVSVPYEADVMEQILKLIAINHPGIHYLIAGMSPRASITLDLSRSFCCSRSAPDRQRPDWTLRRRLLGG